MNTKNDSPKKVNGSAEALLKRSAKLLGLLVLAILVVVVVIGLIPVPLDGFESAPDPAQDYEEALRRFDEILANEESIVNEASGSHLMTHGDRTERVYVLIHGTTNSPLQFAELGEILYERGHNVLILRMPYHASLEIPHNSIDPAADAQKKKSVYAKILELLGEEPLQ